MYEPESFLVQVPWKHKPDLLLKTRSGKKLWIQLKGGNSWRWFNSAYRTKFKAYFEQYSDKYDIRMIFEKDFSWGKTMTVSKWCDKLGIPVAFGNRIPKEWIDE